MGPLPEEINWKWHYLNSPLFFFFHLAKPSERSSHLILMSCHKSKQRGQVFSNFDTSEEEEEKTRTPSCIRRRYVSFSPQKKLMILGFPEDLNLHASKYFFYLATNFWINCFTAPQSQNGIMFTTHYDTCHYANNACHFPDALRIHKLYADVTVSVSLSLMTHNTQYHKCIKMNHLKKHLLMTAVMEPMDW